MGQKQSKASSSAAPNNRKMTTAATTNTTAETAAPPVSSAGGEIGEYNLKKHHPGCTGMFWRADPTGATGGLANNNDWPRDGAVLRGREVTVGQNNNEKWLLATAVKQARSSQWKDAPQGAALPFEYNNHYYLEKAST